MRARSSRSRCLPGVIAAAILAALALAACSGDAGKEADSAAADSAAADSAAATQAGTPPAAAAALETSSLQIQGVGRGGTAAGEATFPHGRHRGVPCSTCHGTVAGHGAHLQAGARCLDCHEAADTTAAPPPSGDLTSCRSCHHGPNAPRTCPVCHADVTRRSLTVRQTLAMTVWSGPRQRELTFEHARHGSLACTRCHTKPGSNAFGLTCVTCHTSHHRPDANCALCHPAPSPGVHTVAAHRGCAGAGCHRDRTVTALPLSRAVCLSCHRSRSEHQPGRNCSDCHAMPESANTRGTR